MKLENLVFDQFLLNYWNAICLFETATPRHDEASHSVSQLASRIRGAYFGARAIRVLCGVQAE